MNSKSTALSLIFFGAVLMLALGCGKAKDAVDEVKVEGNWLMEASGNVAAPLAALAEDSMVLSFKSGKAAFSPANSVKGRALVKALPKCLTGPRPFRVENGFLVFEKVVGCDEKRAQILELTGERLRFADPDNAKITRNFIKIDDARYNQLVLPADRKL